MNRTPPESAGERAPEAGIEHARSVRRAPFDGAIDLAGCLEVEDVAEGSTAWAAGVRPRDLLVAIDARPAALAGEAALQEFRRDRNLEFASLLREERIELVSDPFPVGVRLRPTVRAIHDRFDPRDPDPQQLKILWEVGAFEILLDLTGRVIRGGGGGLLARFARPRPSQDRNTPLLVLKGAALFETGDQREGARLTSEYMEQYAHYWTQDFTAIGTFYQGRSALARGERRAAAAAFHEAFAAFPCERIAKAIEKLTGERPLQQKPRQGRRFPCDYALPSLVAPGRTVALTAALGALRQDQLLTVCLLATYRGNGPYSEFIEHYAALRRTTGGLLADLHVITMVPDRRPDRPHWYAAEDDARAAGLPLDVLLDGTGAVTMALDPHGSPDILMLGGDGTILHEGYPDELAIWTCLRGLRGAALVRA